MLPARRTQPAGACNHWTSGVLNQPLPRWSGCGTPRRRIQIANPAGALDFDTEPKNCQHNGRKECRQHKPGPGITSAAWAEFILCFIIRHNGASMSQGERTGQPISAGTGSNVAQTSCLHRRLPGGRLRSVGTRELAQDQQAGSLLPFSLNPESPPAQGNHFKEGLLVQPSWAAKSQLLAAGEPGGMAVQESEVGPVVVEVGVDIVLLGDSRLAAVIEQPNRQRRIRNRG